MGSIEQPNCREEATIKGIIIGLRFGFLSMLIAEQGALLAVVLHFLGRGWLLFCLEPHAPVTCSYERARGHL